MSKKITLFILIPALFFQGIGALLYFDLLTGTKWASIAYGITKALIILWPLLWFRKLKITDKKDIPHRKQSILWGMGSGILIFVIMIGLFALLKDLFGDTKPLLETKLQDYNITTPAIYITVFVLYSFFHSFIEEYYWRWFLFLGLKKHFTPILAGLLSSIGFGLHHYIVIGQYLPLEFTLFLGTCVIIGGGFWCWMYHKTKSFLGIWISHIFIDLGIFGIGYLLLWG